MNKGRLFVLSGPSGAGKGTVLKGAMPHCKNAFLSVSATTRAPREGEINGISYHFITKDEFEAKIENNEMLEWASYCDNFYGTPKNKVEEMLQSGKDIILEIEMQGAMQVKQSGVDAKFIFVMPPDVETLEKRLRERGTESDDVIQKRMQKALEEIECKNEYDYIIVNDDLEKAVCKLIEIIK